MVSTTSERTERAVNGMSGVARRGPLVGLRVGDFGGGALYLAMGVLAAIYERQNFGRGQVIDAAIVAGTASLMLVFSMLAGARMGKAARGQNMLDGSVHFYRVDECADGKYVSLGAIEPQFYAVFRELLGEDAPEPPHMKARGVYQEAFGIVQAAPAPRFSRMQGAIQGGPPLQFAPWDDVHADWRSCAKHHEDA